MKYIIIMMGMLLVGCSNGITVRDVTTETGKNCTVQVTTEAVGDVTYASKNCTVTVSTK
ncbi:hypothetical protein VPHD315_0100 [Vibrio phage D315]